MPPHAGGSGIDTPTAEAPAPASGNSFMKGASLFALGGVLGGGAVGIASLYEGAGNMSRGAFTPQQGIAVLAGAALVGTVFLVAGMNADG